MAIRKEKKVGIVSEVKDLAAVSEALIVAHYSGLTVAEVSDFRRKARAVNVNVKIAKNRLVDIALKDTPFAGVSKMLKGPTVFAFSSDPVSAAKTLAEFAKENAKLKIVGGGMGGNVLDAKGVDALSKLPSLNELRGMIVGLLVAPATKIARVAQAPATQLARVFAAKAEKGA